MVSVADQTAVYVGRARNRGLRGCCACCRGAAAHSAGRGMAVCVRTRYEDGADGEEGSLVGEEVRSVSHRA